MTKKQKKTLRRILGSTVLFAVVWAVTALASLPPWWEFLLYLLPYALIGWDILWKAVRNIKNGQVFDENFLMALATVGAFGCGEYREGVAVMLFYQVGELFQSVAVSRSRASIAQLMDIRPDSANVERDGQVVTVDPEEVAVDEIIVIRAGERVPLDGTVVEGASALDTAALTGESMPRDVATGDEVVSGCVNLSGLLRVKVSRPFGQSTVAKILDLVENSAAKKAKAEHFITKFARYYTPAVVLCAAPAFADGKMNLNTATEQELSANPAVGPELAKGIVEFRENVGDIKSMDELLEVKGVTPEVLEKLKQAVTVEAIEGAECSC